jgi:alkanesulfonate monooxygenase SsuD/methylene tetrahydromethanopterin reductase-like flavin-dependent oxidoreductase (luciferase family)
MIALAPRALPGGGLDLGQASPEAWDEKVAWVREAAGARFDELELNILLQRVVVTDDQRAAIEAVSDAWRQPVEALRNSPLLLIGSVEQMVDALQERRERFGISYIVVFEPAMEALAPVVARLAGA